MSERRIVLGVHATVSTMLRAFGRRCGNRRSNKAVGANGPGFAGKKQLRAREKEFRTSFASFPETPPEIQALTQ